MSRIASTAALAFLVAAAGCSSTNDREHRQLQVFDRLEMYWRYYDSAQSKGDTELEEVARKEIRRLVAGHFGAIVDGLNSEDVVRQARAAFALGLSESRAAVEPLASATEKDDWAVRANAVAALGLLGFPEVPDEPFRRLLKDHEPRVRVAAVYGLRQLLEADRDRGMLDVVHAQLLDPEWEVRNEALILLRKLGRKDSVDEIVARTLKDPEILVRQNAAATLGSIGPDARAATPELIELLRDPEHRVVDAVWAALKRIHGKDFDRSYGTWRDWYEDELAHHYICLQHSEVEEVVPGNCRECGKELERIPLDTRPVTLADSVLFVCPDHPEVQTASPSRCAKEGCGKDLVTKAPDDVFACPDHPEVQTATPARCGKARCGKDLIRRK